MKTFTLIAIRAVAFLLTMSIFSVVFMYPVKLAMNAVFSATVLFFVFGVPYFSLSKALALSFLTALLFKSAK